MLTEKQNLLTKYLLFLAYDYYDIGTILVFSN